jgi:TRAP-type C4-dicarboxylate transport system substrate-binding protein
MPPFFSLKTCWGCALIVCSWLMSNGWAWAQAREIPAQKLRIVGGLAGINQYTRNEEPFWTQELSRLSNGKFDADIVPFDRAGVPSNDLLRLIQLGVIPFGTALISSVSTQYPEYGVLDLAGLNPDMNHLKKSVAAFRPYLEKMLRERHGIEMLALYVYPAQVLFCKKPLSNLTDLKGRRTRTSSTTQSDFVEAFGGVPVRTGLTQIMSSMASGNTECAITGAMSGNTLGLHEVTSHLHTMPITWGLALFGANRSAWNGLPPDLRALLSKEIPRLEAAIWAESDRETTEGHACNTGASGCRIHRNGRMVSVVVSAEDERRSNAIFTSQILPKWLQRCPNRCADLWNQTLGPAHGILLPMTQ